MTSCAGQAIGYLGLVPEHLEDKEGDFKLVSTEGRKIRFSEMKNIAKFILLNRKHINGSNIVRFLHITMII